LKVGQWAIALGVGFGDKTPALSAGIISATSRIGAKAVQTDANLSPANYGGPLVDIEGRVIGICVPLSPESSEAAAGAEWYDSGIGFAAPLTGIDKILQSLKEGKTLSPPFLGIQSKPAEKFAPGAIVAEIVPESAAAKAGLAKGDVITAVEGTAALDPTHLSSLIRRYVAGDEVTFTVTRGSENKEIRATLGTVPPPPKKPPAKEGEPKKPDAPQPPMKPPPPKM
jgi:serine protease Do